MVARLEHLGRRVDHVDLDGEGALAGLEQVGEIARLQRFNVGTPHRLALPHLAHQAQVRHLVEAARQDHVFVDQVGRNLPCREAIAVDHRARRGVAHRHHDSHAAALVQLRGQLLFQCRFAPAQEVVDPQCQQAGDQHGDDEDDPGIPDD
ncbi:hypothetical protein D3C72_1735100 [compost metagenome]